MVLEPRPRGHRFRPSELWPVLPVLAVWHLVLLALLLSFVWAWSFDGMRRQLAVVTMYAWGGPALVALVLVSWMWLADVPAVSRRTFVAALSLLFGHFVVTLLTGSLDSVLIHPFVVLPLFLTVVVLLLRVSWFARWKSVEIARRNLTAVGADGRG